ncbi:MAG TPA: chemotaxis protein CheW [Gemmatimonadales bacterium]
MRTDGPVIRDRLLGFADTLEQSAEADVSALGPELHLLTFQLEREEYGLPITRVREVIRVTDITRVPQAPPHVRGVTNLRGRILAVVEIRSRLGLEPAVVTPASRIVVVEAHGRVLGLLVDRVSRVTKVPGESVAPVPDDVRSTDADYLTGVARWDSRLIILLDLDRVLLLNR